MPRARNQTPADHQLSAVFSQLSATGAGALGLADKIALLQLARTGSAGASAVLDEFLLREFDQSRDALARATKIVNDQRAFLEKLAMSPLQAAVFLGRASAAGKEGAWVQQGTTSRFAWPGPDVDLAALEIGDEVLLAGESGVIVARAPERPMEGGELATFDRYAEGRRLVLTSRDEEVVAVASRTLDAVELKSGDRIRWDRTLKLAWEKIAKSSSELLFLESTPEESFDDVGGLDDVIERLRCVIALHLHHAATAARYAVERVAGILFEGPSGTGKTLLARALAHECARLSPSGRSRFCHCKPGAVNTPWFGETERKIRETFRLARESAEAEPGIPTILFWDEIDSIGSARGEAFGRIDDRIVQSFFSELDGLEERGNVLVIGATNRIDALDPALVRPKRLGDEVFRIPRPARRGARQIFGKHLVKGIPVAPNGFGDEDQDRAALIESALSRIYSTNGEGDLLQLTFRDGRREPVRARDLVSGAIIAKIVRDACEKACLREIDGGEPGVRREDLSTAIDDAFRTTASALTPRNCRRYLPELPQDMDVVAVQPVARKVAETHRYLRPA